MSWPAPLLNLPGAPAPAPADPGYAPPAWYVVLRRRRRSAAQAPGAVVPGWYLLLRRRGRAATVVVVTPASPGLRDRQLLRLVRDALDATGQFHAVTTYGPPELEGGASDVLKLAGLELAGFDEEFYAQQYPNVFMTRTVRFNLTIHVRDQDPDARDDEADRLYQAAANALGADPTLGGFAYGARLLGGEYMPADNDERRLRARGEFIYHTERRARGSDPD